MPETMDLSLQNNRIKQFRNAASVISKTLEDVYGVRCEPISGDNHWHSRFASRKRLQFYCRHCYPGDGPPPMNALVAIATCNDVDMSFQTTITVDNVFFHDSHKQGDIKRNHYARYGYAEMPFPIDEIFRDTYAGALLTINAVPSSFTLGPPGKSANMVDNQHRNFHKPLDNRKVCPLPCHKYPTVAPEKHKASMIRLAFFLGAQLNISNELAKTRLMPPRQSSSPEWSIKKNVREGRNSMYHMKIGEVKLLMGGNRNEKARLPTNDRTMWQNDAACKSGPAQVTLDDASGDNTDNFAPFAFIIPLETHPDVLLGPLPHSFAR